MRSPRASATDVTPQQDWLFCRFQDVPIFALGLEMDLSIHLYSLGYRTVGALDALIGDYREDVLFVLIGKRRGREVLIRLHDYCRRRLLEQMQDQHEDSL